MRSMDARGRRQSSLLQSLRKRRIRVQSLVVAILFQQEIKQAPH